MAELFPNLPEEKTCPECRRTFPWPTKSDGKKESKREWFKRTRCSQACRLRWFKRTGGLDG